MHSRGWRILLVTFSLLIWTFHKADSEILPHRVIRAMTNSKKQDMHGELSPVLGTLTRSGASGAAGGALESGEHISSSSLSQILALLASSASAASPSAPASNPPSPEYG